MANKEPKPTIDAKFEKKLLSVYGDADVTIEKYKLVDEVVVVTIGEALTATQFKKLKSIAGKKGELVQRGENWLISY